MHPAFIGLLCGVLVALGTAELMYAFGILESDPLTALSVYPRRIVSRIL
jgi:hypothetical protein